MEAIIIRPYRDEDSGTVGRLIKDIYAKFNLAFASPAELPLLLGPFQHAQSDDPAHKAEIARILRAPMMFVAEDGGEIVGVLRGRSDKLQSLFVREDCHRRGVGRSLVERFERECLRQGGTIIKVMATLYATPFYQAVGYKKTTGVRRMRSFDGNGLPYQPMKKVLR